MVVILVILLVLFMGFVSLWAFCKIASSNRDIEEQMEIERKLRESNEKREFTNNKK